MKRVLLAVAFAILAFEINAQSINVRLDTAIYARLDSMPSFPGGLKVFRQYVDENAKKILKPNHATGMIIAQILVEKDGTIKDTPGILEGLSPETDSLAIFLLKHTPRWSPGIKNGKPVRTLMRIPVRIHDISDLKKGQSLEAGDTEELADQLTISEPWNESDESKGDDPNRIYSSVDQAPEFPGGEVGFNRYINENIKLKQSSKADSVKVVISFIVELDGSLTGLRIVEGFSNICNNEALRLLGQSPKWIPGIKNGVPVRAIFLATIYFKPVVKDHLF